MTANRTGSMSSGGALNLEIVETLKFKTNKPIFDPFWNTTTIEIFSLRLHMCNEVSPQPSSLLKRIYFLIQDL